MKVGVASDIYWSSNFDLIKTISHLANELKFEHIEILCEHPFFENWSTFRADKLKKELKNLINTLSIEVYLHAPYHDLNIASWNPSMAEEAVRQTIECVETADYLGSEIVVLHPGFLPSRKFGKEETLEKMIRNFKEITQVAEDLGIKLCLENLAMQDRAFGVSHKGLVDIVEKVSSENFGITLDVAHANTTGISITSFVKETRRYIYHLHVSDNQGKNSHLPVGLGNINFKEFLRSMRDYTGAMIIEGWAPHYMDQFVSWSREKLEEISKEL